MRVLQTIDLGDRVRLRHIATFVLPTFFLLLSYVPVQAQSSSATGRLDGTVVDSSGSVVAGAEVSAINSATGVANTANSNESGYFNFLYLDPGTYLLSVQKSGFQKLQLTNVVISVGTTTTVHPTLAVGRVEETMTVVATAPLVDTSQSSLGSVVGQQSIESLPLNGRNFTDFALLTPGATTDGDFRHDQLQRRCRKFQQLHGRRRQQ